MTGDLRQVIRELLQEELAHLRGAGHTAPPREEAVSLTTDTELAAFVRRLMQLAQDPGARAEIEAGRHVFRLGTPAATPLRADTPRGTAPGAAAPPARFERGLVTEREIARLPDGTRSITLGKHARLTPLARDELGRRGIRMERTGS